eukprot:6272009-Ditylum_brightwellii.AAC.1
MKEYTRMNKTTGVQETNKQCPKALNEFNNTMHCVDFWDLICAPKHVQTCCSLMLFPITKVLIKKKRQQSKEVKASS